MKIIFHKLDLSGRNRKSERRERLCVCDREKERDCWLKVYKVPQLLRGSFTFREAEKQGAMTKH